MATGSNFSGISVLTDSELRAQDVSTNDIYDDGESLADQSGAGAALTFTFANPMDLIWVRCVGGDGRANPFGGVPAASSGLYCADGEPHPITVHTATLKVFAGVGTTVVVWGYRYS